MRQQIERLQVAHVTDQAGEPGNHFRVVCVFLLCNQRHAQVLAYQPHYQFAVICGQTMLAAEFGCINGAFFRMVAAAPFGDVMKEGGDVE